MVQDLVVDYSSKKWNSLSYEVLIICLVKKIMSEFKKLKERLMKKISAYLLFLFVCINSANADYTQRFFCEVTYFANGGQEVVGSGEVEMNGVRVHGAHFIAPEYNVYCYIGDDYPHYLICNVRKGEFDHDTSNVLAQSAISRTSDHLLMHYRPEHALLDFIQVECKKTHN